MSKPTVSILTTVFNREKYLAACIESVLASSYQDWELIIVDDVSTDTSVAIAQRYEKKDARIKVYVNRTNLGDYPNRNKAASYAKGKYLKYLDADDLIYPHGLEIMVHTMEQFPKAALGISQAVVEDEKPYPFILKPKEAYYREFILRGVLTAPPTQTIIRKEIFDKVGKFKPIRHEGDVDLMMRISAKYSIVKLYPELTWWRVHPDQEHQNRANNNLYYHTAMRALKATECPLNEKEVKDAIDQIKKRSIRNILNMAFKKGHFKLALVEFQKSNHKIADVLLALK